MGLSAADMKSVQDTWAKVSGSSFEDAGEKVFLELLKNESTKAHFKKFKDIPYGQLPGNADMRAHGKKVIQVLDDFIKGMGGAGDESVKKVAHNHKKLQLSNDQINVAGAAILAVVTKPEYGGASASWEKLWGEFMAVHKAAY